MKNTSSIILGIVLLAIGFFLGRGCQPQPETTTQTETVTETKWLTDTIEIDKWHPAPPADTRTRELLFQTEQERDGYIQRLTNTESRLAETLAALTQAKENAKNTKGGIGSIAVREELPVTNYVGDTLMYNEKHDISFGFDWNIPVLGELYDAPTFNFTWPQTTTTTNTEKTEVFDNTRNAAWLLEASVIQRFGGDWNREYLPQIGRRKGRFYGKAGTLLSSGGLEGASVTGGIEF